MEERESKRDAMKDWRCVVLFGVVGKIFTGSCCAVILHAR
jgi:hypothetical protein